MVKHTQTICWLLLTNNSPARIAESPNLTNICTIPYHEKRSHQVVIYTLSLTGRKDLIKLNTEKFSIIEKSDFLYDDLLKERSLFNRYVNI